MIRAIDLNVWCCCEFCPVGLVSIQLRLLVVKKHESASGFCVYVTRGKSYGFMSGAVLCCYRRFLILHMLRYPY